jgi:methylmalonyl-CoA/ethylmalonyl-CoA epimerase
MHRRFLLTFNIHHLGVAVRDISLTAAGYIQCFGYQRESDMIHDPAQQAYVQFLRLPGDRVYLELVQPDGPGSTLSRAIAKGGGLNHVCYHTDDIDAACHELRRRGLSLIASPVPAVAFKGRRIAWLMGRDRVITELVERGDEKSL